MLKKIHFKDVFSMTIQNNLNVEIKNHLTDFL